MKRVLIFSLAYYPQVGGAEVALKALTDRIPDIEWHMLTLQFGGSPPEEKVGNVVVHRLGKNSSYLSKILFIPRAALAARALHTRLRFDAQWAMMTYMLLPIVCANLRAPYVVSLQDGDPFLRVFARPHILPFLPLLRRGFRHATAITALSTYLARWAIRMGYRREVVIVPNGAAVTHFASATPFEIEKREGEFWLVTSSRLVVKNAIDDVIRAMVFLPPSVHFLILGVGPEEKKLRVLVERFALSSRVHFQGFVSHNELPGYLKACDAFIRPSRTEGFGASFPEAMAAGLPVVATQEGGIADFLFDEKRNPDKPPTGFAVDRDSPEQIANAVKEIMTNPVKVERIHENAFRLVSEKYDWDTIAKQMQSVFNSILH
jgi:glycosyltransferase involved in cell wall biosynthesis